MFCLTGYNFSAEDRIFVGKENFVKARNFLADTVLFAFLSVLL
jgi:hypothetical protein